MDPYLRYDSVKVGRPAMESQIKGWIGLFGGLFIAFGGVVALEPVVVIVGIAMTILSWATFWYRRRTRDRYKA